MVFVKLITIFDLFLITKKIIEKKYYNESRILQFWLDLLE